jgi:2-oxoglutarate dehydrogenase E2 component (dihydrolipoamide succinyltransferase)
MPQMGESIFEGTITKWLKKAGERVEKDEPLFEISTDKVDAEIPSPVAGILSEIRTPEGSTVAINTVVAVLTQSAEAAAETRAHESADGSATPASSAAVPPQAAPAASRPAPVPASGGTQVVMPQMGESIFEGTITKWLKKVGDRVEKDEPLFEISTDKVDAEIPSPVAGILTHIKTPEGTTVEINTVVAVIGGSAAVNFVESVNSTQPAQAFDATAGDAAQPDASTGLPASSTAGPEAEQADGVPVRSSPLVRRIAREHNLNLSRIAASGIGSGAGGRITKDDVLSYLSQQGSASPAAPARPAVTAGHPAAPVSAIAPPVSTLPGTVVPLSRMRAIIAERMAESVAIAPHVYSVYKIDMTRVVRLRDRARVRFEQQHGVKLTFMPFIAAAAVEALRRHPIVNSSLKDNAIHYHANVNLGIAVALDWGLIVPVIRQAETLSFVALAQTMGDLAERARAKKLKPEEATGSTFTLTNSGVFGGEFGTPIINQPESAILAIGGLKKEPVVITDAEGSDVIAIRSMQTYCLGFDHRLIDGADGGKFMTTFKGVLETWDRETA